MSNIHSNKQWELVVDTEVSKQTLYKYWNNNDISFVDNSYCEFIKDVCEGSWKFLCVFIAIVILNKTLCLSMKKWISFPSWGEQIKPNVRVIHGKHLFSRYYHLGIVLKTWQMSTSLDPTSYFLKNSFVFEVKTYLKEKNRRQFLMGKSHPFILFLL